jgi:hypothetical protein
MTFSRPMALSDLPRHHPMKHDTWYRWKYFS